MFFVAVEEIKHLFRFIKHFKHLFCHTAHFTIHRFFSILSARLGLLIENKIIKLCFEARRFPFPRGSQGGSSAVGVRTLGWSDNDFFEF